MGATKEVEVTRSWLLSRLAVKVAAANDDLLKRMADDLVGKDQLETYRIVDVTDAERRLGE